MSRNGPTLLDDALIEQLENRLRAASVGWLERAAPGLTDSEMDALTEPLGLSLPIEARVWWGWRNGASQRPGEIAPAIGPGHEFISLEQAVSRCQMEREIPATPWRDEWMPLFTAPPIVCDCSVLSGEPTPVCCVDYHRDPEGKFFAGDAPAQSLGELITWWIETIDNGAWTYVPEFEGWERDEQKCDPWLRRAGLI
jgi:hypothetical protein